ncbi:MAG: PAS domain-containing sensor histidine kinase [Desulfatiglandaceae bacterium]
MAQTGNNLLGFHGTGDQSQNIAFFSFIIDSLPIGILTVSPELKVLSFNPWAQKITGYSEDEALGHYCGNILQGGMCKLRCPLKTAIDRQHPVVRLETTIQTKHGETIPVRMNTAALLDDNDNLIGGVEAFQDISHIKTLEREKDNLISMFAHDMKSSLTIIGGFVLRLLKKPGQLEEKKQQDYLGIIKSETGKLDLLVNDFLEFSRLQTGRLKLNLTATSLDKELMEITDSYQLEAAKSGLDLTFESEQELPVIMGDTRQLRRVFANLLDNAIKFSRGKGTITISTHETKKEIMVKVKDQGIGIPSDDLPYIFDSFHRGNTSTSKEGFGLGLASVKAIVEGHGGRIRVQSQPGKGSVFTVILPKKGPSDHQEAPKGNRTTPWG